MSSNLRVARLILTVELVVGVLLSFLLDWSGNHLLHPDWHPHARFHGGLLLFYLAGVSGTALWLMWRKSLEPQVGINAAVLMITAFWTPLFYVAALVPGSTAWAGPVGREPLVLPNLVVALVFVAVAIGARALARSATGSR